MSIEVIDCPSGDWVVVKINGKIFHEGHSIDGCTLEDILRHLGNEVISTIISDEDMEEGVYYD